MGIDVDRAISFAFGLGGALAGVGGFVYFAYFTQARFDLGFRLGLFAFTAAVLGGIGNMTGAALASLKTLQDQRSDSSWRFCHEEVFAGYGRCRGLRLRPG